MARSTWGRLLKVDPLPFLASSKNPAIAFFSGRDLFGREAGPVSALWDLPEARKIVAKQNPDGSWRYPGGKSYVRSRENYDQLETFRQVGILVEEFGFTRKHPAIERAAEFLFSFQTDEGDFRGIYGNQYATTYVGAIMELLIKAGYTDDPRIAKGFRWLLAMRQSDGGWAIPLRTVGASFSEFLDLMWRRKPIAPDQSKPSSHLVTGMVLRAFAAHPVHRRSAEARRAGELLATRLYKKDAYGDRGDVSYWERVSFPFWFTDIVSALDSLSRLGFGLDVPAIRAALDRLKKVQRADGSFGLRLMKNKSADLPWWICLAVCRSLKRWLLPAFLGLALAMAACKTPHASTAKVPSRIPGNMVEIPGGAFAMGSDSKDANENERPVHPVTVKGFHLDRTEVTVDAYAQCVRAGACSEPDAYHNERGNYRIFCNWKHPQDRSSHPINCVDFPQATAFCAWAGKRLPSEEEWEYAARAGSEGRTYPWGNDKPDQSRLNACGSECPANLVAKGFPRWPPMYEADDGWPETAPVGSFPAGASKHGVLDLAGNVWEWTASEYAAYDGSHTEKKPVLRGGSWGGGDPRIERTTNRFRLDPSSRAQFLGFRCAQ